MYRLFSANGRRQHSRCHMHECFTEEVHTFDLATVHLQRLTDAPSRNTVAETWSITGMHLNASNASLMATFAYSESTLCARSESRSTV